MPQLRNSLIGSTTYVGFTTLWRLTGGKGYINSLRVSRTIDWWLSRLADRPSLGEVGSFHSQVIAATSLIFQQFRPLSTRHRASWGRTEETRA
jgi:hypothetical protein